MSKYLHLSLDMRSDIEVMLAKKFSFNRIAQALGGRGGSYLFQILECILSSCLLCGKKEKSILVRLIIVFFSYKAHIYTKILFKFRKR